MVPVWPVVGEAGLWERSAWALPSSLQEAVWQFSASTELRFFLEPDPASR